MEEVVRQVVTRCIEEALDAEVTALLERDWYERRKVGQWQQGRQALQTKGDQEQQNPRQEKDVHAFARHHPSRPAGCTRATHNSPARCGKDQEVHAA
jgi:hypothetical protein